MSNFTELVLSCNYKTSENYQSNETLFKGVDTEKWVMEQILLRKLQDHEKSIMIDILMTLVDKKKMLTVLYDSLKQQYNTYTKYNHYVSIIDSKKTKTLATLKKMKGIFNTDHGYGEGLIYHWQQNLLLYYICDKNFFATFKEILETETDETFKRNFMSKISTCLEFDFTVNFRPYSFKDKTGLVQLKDFCEKYMADVKWSVTKINTNMKPSKTEETEFMNTL